LQYRAAGGSARASPAARSTLRAAARAGGRAAAGPFLRRHQTIVRKLRGKASFAAYGVCDASTPGIPLARTHAQHAPPRAFSMYARI